MPTSSLTRRALPAGFLLFLAALGCSSSPTSSTNHPPTPMAGDVDIVVGASTMGAGAFSPDTKNLSLGGATTASVRFVNGDVSSGTYGGTAVTHHIVSDDGTSFDTGNLGANGTATEQLAAGTYTYHCEIHPTMTGTVIVSP